MSNEHKPSPFSPTMKNAILSHCHECMGHYTDGRVDCENVNCQFYSFMPYAQKTANLEWTKYNYRKSGKVIRMKKILSDEEKREIREKLSKSNHAD